jgi:hypothetical protein
MLTEKRRGLRVPPATEGRAEIRYKYIEQVDYICKQHHEKLLSISKRISAQMGAEPAGLALVGIMLYSRKQMILDRASRN